MKFLVELGKQLDLNVAWDGGLPDNVTYQVSSNDNAVTITNDGVVSGINVGIAVVKFINSGGVEVGSAIFEVMTAQQYEKVNALRSGTKTLTVEAVEVSNVPTFTLVTGGTAFASSTYEGSPANAYDGQDGTLGYPPATLWGSYDTFASTINAFIGKNFDSPKMIKKIRVQWVTAPTQVDVIVHNGNINVAPLTTINPVYQDFNGPSTVQWQEFILPAYTPMTGIILKPKVATAVSGSYWETHGGVIDRFRVWEIEFYE